MKKFLVDLTAIKRVDPVPLRKALETYKKAKSEVAGGKGRLLAIQKEIDDFLAGTNADDTERLQIISAKQLQVQILPNLIRRVEKQIDSDLFRALLKEAHQFQHAIIDFYSSAANETARQIATYFRPFISQEGVALDVALRFSDDCKVVGGRIGAAQAITLPNELMGRSSYSERDKESIDREIIEAAVQLLALASKS